MDSINLSLLSSFHHGINPELGNREKVVAATWLALRQKGKEVDGGEVEFERRTES